MPHTIPIPDIQDALVELLLADTAFVALIQTKPSSKGGGPAIYDEGDVAQGQLFPYLTIGAWTQVPFHSLGSSYGWNCTVQLKAIGQRQLTLYQAMGAALEVLAEGLEVDVTGYNTSTMGESTVQPMFREILNGVPVFSLPAILRVYVT